MNSARIRCDATPLCCWIKERGVGGGIARGRFLPKLRSSFLNENCCLRKCLALEPHSNKSTMRKRTDAHLYKALCQRSKSSTRHVRSPKPCRVHPDLATHVAACHRNNVSYMECERGGELHLAKHWDQTLARICICITPESTFLYQMSGWADGRRCVQIGSLSSNAFERGTLSIRYY